MSQSEYHTKTASLWPWPWKQYSNLLYNTLADDNCYTSSYHVWLQKAQQFRRYHLVKKKFLDQMSSSSKILTVTLPLQESSLWPWPWWLQPIFCLPLLSRSMVILMIMHHHIKFGYKRFCGSQPYFQTNISSDFEHLLWPWAWSQQSNAGL